MKKITFLCLIFLAGTSYGFSQTLNESANWPNAGWTVAGVFDAANPDVFEADPTVDANFAYDDDDQGNATGSNDNEIYAESPVIDLSAAFGAGETWLTVSGDYVHRYLLADFLTYQYWDVDAAAWMDWGAPFATNTAGAPTDDYCSVTAVVYTTDVLNIVGFTATQLSGFQYRIYYNDDLAGADWNYGFCFSSPTIASVTPPSCPDPSALSASGITDTTADLAWTEAGSATAWNIELVDITGGGAATGSATTSGVTNPFNQTGLEASTDYEYYVQADCGTGGTSSWIGPLAFSTTVACLAPSALNVTNVLTTSADLGWTAGGSEVLWDIELVDITAAGTASGTATTTGVANPYNQTGLVPANDYEFYVRADCAANGTSTWTGPYAFTSECVAISAPYTEDFETFATGGSAFSGDNCWSGTGGLYYWESAPGTDGGSGGTGPDPSITTGNYFYTEASGGTPGDTTDLTSPLVDLTGLTAPSLLFNYHMFGGEIGTLDVLVNGTANVFTIAGQQQVSETTLWELAVIDLTAYVGQTISVTFRGTSAGTFEGDISIDNVVFDELPSCPLPNALTIFNITDTIADLAWTENGTATSWDIEIVDLTAAGVATGIPTAVGITNPYTVMGLTENNDYAYYVRSDCGGGTFSVWAGPFNFSTLETCPAPTLLTATNITETTADLGWTESGVSTSWNIEVVNSTGGGVVTGTATAAGVANPYAATGLVGDNNYEFYVQSDCGVDGVSAWEGPFPFATAYEAVPPTCANGIFLDSGGISGDYSAGEDITYTICPDNAGDAVTVDFTAFSTENSGTGCYDGLTIHDGADALATTIDPPAGGTIWCWDRDDMPASGSGDLQGMTITSSDASGCITFVFTSDGSVQREGWEAIVSCDMLNVNQFDATTAFTYYPNPVKNELTLNAKNAIKNVVVLNMLGQEVLVITPNAVNSTINMNKLSQGAYFVKVTIGNVTETIRVIKR